MKCDYRMREDRITDEEGIQHTVYGVEAWSKNELVRSVPDVFFDRALAEHYIGLFNSLDLRLCHLDDVIEDVL
ncbi:MAG: hypothetical protein IKB51_03915 [Clostridia bacterium]|nr:hypothetical protein [Clostridia bacterium]